MDTRDLFNRLHADMAEDGMILSYLPVNQAYMVTFGGYDGPRMIGPCPMRVVVDWWHDMQYRETEARGVCYD